MSYQAYNPEIESHFLATLIQFGPAVYSDVTLASEKDFSPVHKPIYSVLRQALESAPDEPLTTVLIAERLKAYGVDASKLAGVEPYDYIWALSAKPVTKDGMTGLFEKLKKITVRRELVEKLKEGEKALRETDAESFSDMVGIVDKTLTSVNTEYYRPPEATDVMDSIESIVEERGNNPIDADSMGYLGPLPSLNKTIGSALISPSSLTVLTARTANGKSAFSFFYCVSIAEQYGIPLLWVDSGEMTVEQLQMRAVCCLSKGRVPLWAVKSGEWRKNKDWVRIIRDEVWPRVKKIKMYYHGVGGMSPKDKISFIKRFYFNKVGRDNFLLISDDYIKGVEALGKQTSEYQSVGYYLADVKTLITEDIKASYWTSVQANRAGIHQGKKVEDIADNEGVISLSDRVGHNASTILLLRHKVPEELAAEQNKFGNVVLKPLKVRESSAKQYEKILKPVKTPNGRFVANYFNLNTNSFYYEDKGLYSESLDLMGQGVIAVDPISGEKTFTL